MDQGPGGSWRGMLTEAIASRIAAWRQQPQRNGPDFDRSGRRRHVKTRDHAERHQRALVAVHGHGFVRAARHVGGHFRRRHLCHRPTHGHARIRRRRKRGKYEACDQKDRQQPDEVGRDFHGSNLSRSSRDGNLGWITNSPESGNEWFDLPQMVNHFREPARARSAGHDRALTYQSVRAAKTFKGQGRGQPR